VPSQQSPGNALSGRNRENCEILIPDVDFFG